MKNYSLVLSLLLLATALVYANSLANPFVTDDKYIILKNFQPGQSWTLKDIFNRSLFSTDPSTPIYESVYFRPLTLFTFALNYPLAKEKPLGYRAVNLALHLSVVVLIVTFLSHLAGRWVAIFSALLYALHPVHVEAVSYISSRSDCLYTALALISLIFWYKGNRVPGLRRVLYLGFALSAFFLGLFAKETIIVVPALAVVMDLIWNPSDSWRAKIRENLGWYLGFALLFSAYLLIRLGAGFPLSMEGGREFGIIHRIFFAFKLFGLYLGLAFYPAHLSFFRVVPIAESLFEWQVVLGAILLAGMLSLAWLLRRSHKAISFGILWYLVSILPVLNLTLLNAPMMEHWLYLPLIGLALAFVGAVRVLAERLGEIRGAALGLALLALLLSARTASRNAEWGDLLKLYLRDVSSYPGNPVAWGRLADTMTERGMLSKAIRAYQISLTLNPNNNTAWLSLGRTLSLAGREDEAEEVLTKAVSLQPRDPWAYYLLGVHRLIVGRDRPAVETLEKSVVLKESPATYHVLGSAYLKSGQKENAERAFHKATLMYPGQQKFHSGVHVDLGKLYLRQGKLKEAREEWQLALRFDPNNAEARSLLQGHVKP